MEQRQSTKEDYRRRIEAVVRYIDEHLNTDFDLDELAEIACFSRWHFQHIMHAWLGEPVWTHVMRRRAETAATLLRQTELTVSEIAWEVGYDAPSSLTKAFRLFYNISPMEYRNNKNVIIMNTLNVNENVILKAPKIQSIEPKQTIYVELTGKYSSLDFGGTWSRLWQFVKENKLFSAGIEHIAFYFDNPRVTEASRLRTHICLTVRKPAEAKGEINVKTIEVGKYAKFLYQGPYSNLSAVYDTIYSRWLPESGCTLKDIPWFEKYINNPNNTSPEKLKTEIYIPVE
ncbi:MAG: AraC family transcriptional regulator [Tannerella sp.]|jgi:AraC family transcriptional regulator|nr:AraC family transcriptional regulator [Tannerella sp.]